MDYSALAAGAAALVKECGQPALLVRGAIGFPCDVLEDAKESLSIYSSSLRKDSLISEADRFFMLTGAVPAVGDHLVIGAVNLYVAAVRPLSPGATPIYYELRAT